MKALRPLHRNPNGHWCRCPWGPGVREPYVSPNDREVYGSTDVPQEYLELGKKMASVHLAFWKEASKLEWLRGRGDKHPGIDSFLDHLDRHMGADTFLDVARKEKGWSAADLYTRMLANKSNELRAQGMGEDELAQALQPMIDNLMEQLKGDKPPGGAAEVLGMTKQELADRLKLGKQRDALFPWLVSNFKKGLVHPQESGWRPDGEWQQDAYPFTYKTTDGRLEGLDVEDLDMVNRYMNYRKQNKQGINIDQHSIDNIMEDAGKWDAGGEEVYNAADDPDAPSPYSWGDQDQFYGPLKIVHLRNRRDLRHEGRKLNHCIGTSGQRYDKQIDDGVGLFYSVRTQDNRPLGTIAFERSKEHYYKCPSCGKFTPGEDHRGYVQETEDDEGNITPGGYYYSVQCENCDHVLAESEPGSYAEPTPTEGTKIFPVHASKDMAKKPDSRFVQFDDSGGSGFYGHSDSRVPDPAVDIANHWFRQFGHDNVYSSSDDRNEHEEGEEFEPWWDQHYYPYSPGSVDSFIHWNNDPSDYASENVDDEYHRAHRDAEDHGMEGPYLDTDSIADNIDLDSIWDDFTPRRMEDVDPEKMNRLVQAMDDSGWGDEWRERMQGWLDDEYTPYLDPYGQAGGPGNNTGFGRPPQTEPPGMDAPHLPSQHYPTSFPHEEYFARNLMYHLNKNLDPQTGENKRWDAYPALDATGLAPKYYDQGERPPVPEQTGPAQTTYFTPNPYGTGGRYRDTQLPYGRGPTPPGFNEPNGDTDQMNLFREHLQDVPMTDDERINLYDQHYRRYRPRPTEEQRAREQEALNRHNQENPEFLPQNLPPDADVRPQFYSPGEAFDPEREPTQTPLPNFPDAYRPDLLDEFQRHQEQGSLIPQRWYVDHRAMDTRRRDMGLEVNQTNLPAELFPPDHFTLLGAQPHPDQARMWDRNYAAGTIDRPALVAERQVNINTQTPMYDQLNEVPATDEAAQRYEQHIQRPFGDWRAKHIPRDSEAHANGRIIRFKGKHYATLPKHEWRVPVIYDKTANQLIVGQPSQQHDDLARQFDMDPPWNENMEPTHTSMPGFIDTEGDVDPGLSFFDQDFEPDDPDELHDWVEDEYGVRKEDQKRKPNVVWGSYHPRQEDEWVAEDEPDFSATIPEPRWHHDSIQR